jgi:hypothetical protein
MVGPQVDTNNAIQVLKYRLEVPENLNPSSVVWHYNTQSGGNVEYFTVTVSDQGYSSSTGQERVVQASLTRDTGPILIGPVYETTVMKSHRTTCVIVRQ